MKTKTKPETVKTATLQRVLLLVPGTVIKHKSKIEQNRGLKIISLRGPEPEQQSK
jgi:hypothetical protein